MTSDARQMTRWANAIGVWLYRRSRGRLVGPAKGTIVGLLTVAGRRTGIARTVAIGLHNHGDGYLVAGTGSGSRYEPQWFRNLRAANHAQIQIGAAHIDVDIRIVDLVERDRLWRDVILVQAPWRRRYEQMTGRTIPIAVLTPRRTRDRLNG
ncbi:nitroreductase/quinone reductase family protein [Dactylosporangium sp. CA-139066]|uniref:nitroreductase/quinone reductase family protein n=1 Tax=Dactylosporangium sp. CA-139066 TaxID=3239930 RepID=UPI003D93B749